MSTRHRKTKATQGPRRPQARPAEILEAALDLFTEQGFSATRMDDVASRAGLSKAAIYLYFADKNALLKGVIDSLVTTNITTLAAQVAAHPGPVAPLLKQALMLVGSRVQNSRLPDLIKLIISESRAHPEIGRAYIDNVLSKALPMMQALVERGIKSGEFRSVDPRLTVKSIVGPMVLAAIWRSVFQPLGAQPLDAEALAAHHADLILAGLKSQSAEPGRLP